MGRHQENDDEPIIKVTSVKKDFSTYLQSRIAIMIMTKNNGNTFIFLYNVTHIQNTIHQCYNTLVITIS